MPSVNLEDIELVKLVRERENDETIAVSWDDLESDINLTSM